MHNGRTYEVFSVEPMTPLVARWADGPTTPEISAFLSESQLLELAGQVRRATAAEWDAIQRSLAEPERPSVVKQTVVDWSIEVVAVLEPSKAGRCRMITLQVTGDPDRRWSGCAPPSDNLLDNLLAVDVDGAPVIFGFVNQSDASVRITDSTGTKIRHVTAANGTFLGSGGVDPADSTNFIGPFTVEVIQKTAAGVDTVIASETVSLTKWRGQ
jgi:hypothetical protein